MLEFVSFCRVLRLALVSRQRRVHEAIRVSLDDVRNVQKRGNAARPLQRSSETSANYSFFVLPFCLCSSPGAEPTTPDKAPCAALPVAVTGHVTVAVGCVALRAKRAENQVHVSRPSVLLLS